MPRRRESLFEAPTLKIAAVYGEARDITYSGGSAGHRARIREGSGARDKTTRESGHDAGRETKSARGLEQSGGGRAMGHRTPSGQLSSPARGRRDCRSAGQTDSVPTRGAREAESASR